MKRRQYRWRVLASSSSSCVCTPYVQESKKLQVIIINKYVRKCLACKNGNEILIWSWKNSGVIWWVWKVKWGTCCDCRCWRLYRICRGIPLMRFLMLGVCWCLNFLGESMICILQITWSAWWRWQILLSLLWLLFIWTWYILHLYVCVSVSNFIFLEGEGGVSGVSER